ncbi:RelA/SpoT domain-containing protein [Burkholderia multivorans]|uniref:RelA/SpoT domain-containing protein n=1 Tax=Burkholderia multivorans TaxID=87883 RepID=UPI0020196D53|nr:RelA/SpoT domain-containing protein [Burkholderia multivorans]MCO1341920.1 RelA/SpoT domain-containing protein [Burkholderia multivorans]MCO1441025.1 RelA/SpoT domain-containing protein [Burkholderia multivorans]UQO32169.1 RelA/SpoT domain-containing protein [Burkholderia multivorans]UQO45306.1 RelA/SpoT domain-containing protein [Burkholderia multivorans]
MAWVEPEFSRERVNAAGRRLVEGVRFPDDGLHIQHADLEEYFEATMIMSNWRASHQFPLNTFKINLRDRAIRIDDAAFVAQRLKRATSIIDKLKRFPRMRLSQMQDIGGCRAVLSSLEQVHQLRESIKGSRIKHRLVNEKDYIITPKADGYRGIHLIYRYVSDKKETYNNHSIEIQIRTKRQHAWATAVETVGSLTNQKLKADQGEQAWLEYFSLISAAFAHREGVPGGEDFEVIRERLKAFEADLHVVERLTAFQAMMKEVIADPDRRKSAYFLMKLDLAKQETLVVSYSQEQFAEATAHYKKNRRRKQTRG